MKSNIQHFIVTTLLLAIFCYGFYIGSVYWPEWNVNFSISLSIIFFSIGMGVAYLFYVVLVEDVDQAQLKKEIQDLQKKLEEKKKSESQG